MHFKSNEILILFILNYQEYIYAIIHLRISEILFQTMSEDYR